MAGQRLSAGVVVVREEDASFRFLLLRAYKNWDFPKGLVESGEEPRTAAVRETKEETGIDDLAFDWGTEFCETEPYARGKVARYYLARTRVAKVVLGVNPALGRPEHHEYRWADLTESFALTAPRLRPVIAWAARRLTGGEELA